MIWVGVDVGGTFTDVVLVDRETGTVRSGKSPSDAADPAGAVLGALSSMDVSLPSVERFRHGATIATNTTLERAGARLGVLTTQGHRDVLIVGKGNRSKLYDIKATRPRGLVKRSQVIEIPERITADGAILRALDETAVDAAVTRLRANETEAVAVCFLHAYANPEHEQRVVDRLRAELPGIPIVGSAEVVAEIREYDRFMTTALNAYVAPRMSRYLSRLEAELNRAGLPVAPEIMTSSGGSWPFSRMARLPVNSILSGPAGGVIGAAQLAQSIGIRDLITCDMGGTSTDTALIRDGRYELAAEGTIGGLPNHAPQIEINTVGAGGGSLAYLDTGGFLNVGPRSAGAAPGPACYGRGGVEPTVTDANVVLGRFASETPLGGEIVLDVEAASRAVDALARKLGLDRMSTAEGMLRIAVSRMTGAIKEISVMRGIDPRDFALLSFGGAGPLHAAAVADELGIKRVVVPPLPGAFSAFGLLVAERRHDFSKSSVLALENTSWAQIQAIIEPLRESARETLAAEGFADARMRFEVFVDMRFRGQAFELSIPLAPDVQDIDGLMRQFHAIYEQRYAHADSGLVEAVSFRVAGHGLGEKPRFPQVSADGTLANAHTGNRPVCFDGKMLDTAICARECLPAKVALAGPAIIAEAGSATVVPPGFSAQCDESGALFLTRA